MRPICLYVCLLLAFVKPALGQATFVFRNFVPPELDAPVFNADGLRLSGTDYVAVLYGGPTTDSLVLANAGVGSMSPVPFTATGNAQAGYFSRAGAVFVDNVSEGGLAWLQVRAWDARLGSTYDDVLRLGLGGYGASSLFQARGGDVLGVVPPQPLIGLESFSLVPEPGTWALLAIGAGALFWKCWRHRSR